MARESLGLLSLQSLENAGLPASFVNRQDGNQLLGGCPSQVNELWNTFARTMDTTFNSCVHCWKKLKHFVCYSMDATSRCVIIVAIFLLLIILASRFIVDHSDLEQSQMPIIDNNNIDINMDDMIFHGDDDDNIIPEMPEFETVDTLFRPTQIPIIGDDTIDNNDNHSNNDQGNHKKIAFDQWYTISSIDWTNIQIRRWVKNKDVIITKQLTMSSEKKKARIIKVEPTRNKILIKYKHNCWWRCEEEKYFHSSECIYFELPEIDDTPSYTPSPNGNGNGNGNGIPFDQKQLFQRIDKMMEQSENLKEWVKDYTLNQVEHIQENVNNQQNSLEKFWKDATNDLYDKLSPKLDEINNKVDRHQNTIDSIQSTQQQHQQLLEQHAEIINNILNNQNVANIHPNETSNTYNNTIDWDKIESRIDNKIESAIDKQLEKNFDNLAQQIATEMAKAIITDNPPINDDIIRGGGDYISDEDHRKNYDENGDTSTVNWAYRVIRHSKTKTMYNDAIYGYAWKVIRMLQIWDQSAIMQSYKPGDCTPLLLDGEDNPYITIELYQPIYVTKISLYHYHSIVLTQEAKNAAPKDFQIWASADGSKWFDLGNYTYDYENDIHEQYFNVIDWRKINDSNQEQGNENDDNQQMDIPSYVNVDVFLYDDDEEQPTQQEDIVNGTSVSNDNDHLNGWKYIAFRLLSNYGGSDYGCIYQIKVFGDIIS